MLAVFGFVLFLLLVAVLVLFLGGVMLVSRVLPVVPVAVAAGTAAATSPR